MVADAESSDSMAGSSRSAAEKHVDRCLDKRAQEKAPKKNHKAEREKLKRDQLNDLFVELSSMLDHDRQNSGKATVLGDAARVLRDLITQVESLRKEQSTLLTECQYVSFEILSAYILAFQKRCIYSCSKFKHFACSVLPPFLNISLLRDFTRDLHTEQNE
ncbi:transcription factor bHLH34 [Hordeum vulgare]|nr:transcription factor bHLH34 [Hordeum vulgare]